MRKLVLTLFVAVSFALRINAQGDGQTTIQVWDFMVRNTSRVQDVARRFNVNESDIRKYSEIHGKTVYPGKVLRIPVRVRPATWNPANFNPNKAFLSGEDTRPQLEFEWNSDSLDSQILEDFILISDIRADSVQADKISKHISRIDKKILDLNWQLDSIKNTEFAFKYDEKDMNSVLKRMEFARQRFYAQGPIGVKVDSLNDLKRKLGEEANRLRTRLSESEYLSENANYFEKNKEGSTDLDLKAQGRTGDQIMAESKYLEAKQSKRLLSKNAKKNKLVEEAAPEVLERRPAEPAIEPESVMMEVQKKRELNHQTEKETSKLIELKPTETSVQQTLHESIKKEENTTQVVETHNPEIKRDVNSPAGDQPKSVEIDSIMLVAKSTPVKTEKDIKASQESNEVMQKDSEGAKIKATKNEADTVQNVYNKTKTEVTKESNKNDDQSSATKLQEPIVKPAEPIKRSVILQDTIVAVKTTNVLTYNSKQKGIEDTKEIPNIINNKKEEVKQITDSAISPAIVESDRQNMPPAKEQETISKELPLDPSQIKKEESAKQLNTENSFKQSLSTEIVTVETKKKKNGPKEDVVPPKTSNKKKIKEEKQEVFIRDTQALQVLGEQTSSSEIVSKNVSLKVNVQKLEAKKVLEKKEDPLDKYTEGSAFSFRGIPIQNISVGMVKDRPRYLIPVDSNTKWKAEIWLNRFKDEMNKTDFKKAEQYLRKSIDINPNNSKAWTYHAEMQAASGHGQDALKEFMIAIAVDSLNARPFYKMALLYENSNNTDKAYEFYSQAIDVDSNYARAYFSRADLSVRLNDRMAAIEDYTRLIEVNKYFSKAYKERGVLKMKERDYSGALADFNAYLDIEDPDGEVLYRRGIANVYLGKIIDGCNDFNASLQLKYTEAEAAVKKYCE